MTGVACDNVMYHVYMREVWCHEWNADQEEWSTGSCEVSGSAVAAALCTSFLIYAFMQILCKHETIVTTTAVIC